jgi:perosamine synthetase
MIRLFKVAMNPAAKYEVAEVLQSGFIGQGPKVEEFEQAFGHLVDAPYPPLSTNSCTSALDLALHLIGVGRYDQVISTPMTCTATNGVIVNRRASIVWADVHPETGLISAEDVERKITPRTKAIMAVDWGGRPCDYEHLKSFGIPVIEDAAHSLLAKIDGESIARRGGDYVAWSFQAIKHLTTGDGGALLAPPEQMERARLLRWYGLDRRSSESFRCSQDIEEAGFKYHMNDIAAAIGLANLELARQNVYAHRLNASTYSEVLSAEEDWESSWWLYTVLVDDRDHFIREMAERGIEASPVHSRNDHHRAFRFDSGPLPGVDYFASHEVAVPVGWWLDEDDLERICDGLETLVRRRHHPTLEEASYRARCS